MKRLSSLVFVLALLAPSLALAQAAPPDASRLFSHQADVVQLGATSYRLPLSAEVLSICRPDLSDVRLYDYVDQEIPWMLDSATRLLTPETEQISQVSAPVLETVTHEVEGTPRAPTGYREVYEIAGPGDPPSRAAWDLAIGSLRDHFVADVRVILTDADGTERELGRASAFRFVGPLRERLRIPVTAPGLGHVRIEIHGRDGFLDPTFTWLATRRARAAEELVVPLVITSRVREGTQTVLTINRPEGIVPETLRFTTTTTAFLRSVHVETSGASTDGSLWRAPGDSGAESLEVPAPAAREPTFVVRIDDQDSPALEELGVAAVLARPVLVYFTQAHVLRFGGGRTRAPHYDLSALQGSWAVDQLLDGRDTPLDATLGPITESPQWTNEPALAFLQRAGVAVPPDQHAYSAPLEVTAAHEGGSRFVLDASILAAARQDLADLRIVDAQGQQWPYLFRDTDPLHVAVTIGAGVRDGAETRYEVPLPVPRVAASELHVDPDAPLVSRAARLLGVDARGDERELTNTTLSRFPGDETTPLVIGLDPMQRIASLALLVTDGSETPLVFRAAELRVPTREVVLVAPPGSYRVLVGDDDAAAPTYEIESVRGLLDTIPLDDAVLGALAANPAHHEPTFWERTDTSTLGLWAVLALAVLVLGVLTWRASRMPEEAEGREEGKGAGEGKGEKQGEDAGEDEDEKGGS